MKEKNDFKAKKGMNQLAQPRSCFHCGYQEVEQVEFVRGSMSHHIRRVAISAIWDYFVPKTYPLYGWRCMGCGYVMWFTARYLD